MKPFRIILIFMLLVFCDREILDAQKIWTLDQCINHAWENNYLVRTQELGLDIRKSDYRQARNDLLPDIGFETSYTKYFGRSIDPNTNSYIDVKFFNNTYGLSATVDLFNGFMKLNMLGMQRLNYEAEKNRLQQIRNEVAFTVITSYFEVLLQQGLYSIALENFRLSRNQLDYTKEFVRLGRKPGTDLLETEAIFATDSSLLIQSYNLLDQAVLSLKYQMNFPPDDSLITDTVVPMIFTGFGDTLSMQVLYNTASSALPDLFYARNTMMAAKKEIQVSKGAFAPRLGFVAGWNSLYTGTNSDSMNRIIPFQNQFSNNANEYLSLGLQIPLFSRFSKLTALRKSKLRYEQAKVQYDDVSYKLKMSAEQHLTGWRAARAEYRASRSQLARSLKAYEAAQKKLEKGLINIIDFEIQKNYWIKAKAEVLRTGLQVVLRERYLRYFLTGSLLAGR